MGRSVAHVGVSVATDCNRIGLNITHYVQNQHKRNKVNQLSAHNIPPS